MLTSLFAGHAGASCDKLLKRDWKTYYQLDESGRRATYANGKMVEMHFGLVIMGDGPVFARTGRPLDALEFAGVIDPRKLKDRAVLDVGAGDGELVKDLRAKGVKAYGTDAYLSHAQLETGFLIPAFTASLPFRNQKFDLVISSYSTFHYSADPETHAAELKEIARVLKKGGRLLIVGEVSRKAFLEALSRFDHKLTHGKNPNWVPYATLNFLNLGN